MKRRFYLIWTIAIVLMVSTTITESSESWPKWKTNPKYKWAKLYNRMPTPMRLMYFNAIIRSHTEERLCEATEDIFKGVSKNGLACWAVRCSNGNAYVVVVRGDGNTSLLTCKAIEKRGGQCF